MMPNRSNAQRFDKGLFAGIALAFAVLAVLAFLPSGFLVVPLIAVGLGVAGVGMAVLSLARVLAAVQRRPETAAAVAEIVAVEPAPVDEAEARKAALLSNLTEEEIEKVLELAWRHAHGTPIRSHSAGGRPHRTRRHPTMEGEPVRSGDM